MSKIPHGTHHASEGSGPLPDLQDILTRMDQGRLDEALAALDVLVAQAPGYTVAHVVRARALEAASRWEEAFRAWQTAQFFAPASPTVSAGLRRTLSHLAAAPAGLEQLVTERSGAPAARASAPPTSPPDFEDLDRLIAELEAARIVPDPDLENMPPPELENEIDDVVSETLARIYAAQNQFEEAARVYEQLASQEPERATEYLQKATEMRRKAR
ncbi:hypothetical protein GQ464_002940 [Rhodocaloribacter litoris]|uniref:tetratricopeptide repeat protein n=1 Tax=Rhodocaloribacter litoris TaxID=2558931 RepID=UPI0014202460|nr:tetratricopeptide repeat protein [Rhodocaloribacter litoris]QXD15921.1 hypothetical protein GQ464_002940 [Rhodocaloribacter litoris]GIV60183.1 MAG: hypothetical protein KatS3mg043_1272 [Rhodothermaceae bacterium]